MFPATFSSQKEYDSYLSCLSKLKIGDLIVAPANYGTTVTGILIYKELVTPRSYRDYSNNISYYSYNILIGSERSDDFNGLFYRPSPIEKRRFLSPAKIACPKILVGATDIYWVSNATRIEKIIKYNGQQEKKEKEKKAKAAKSVRIIRLHEDERGPNET